MDLLQLEYFCTVAQYESISKAAQHHSIPQPAMSRTISRLERELCIDLFDRSSNSVKLNEAGYKFYLKIMPALRSIINSKNDLSDNREELSGHIFLCVRGVDKLIDDCIVKFSKKNPKVSFTIIKYTRALSPLVAFSDLFISHEPPDRIKYRSIYLAKEDFLICSSKNFIDCKNGIVNLSDLINLPFIAVSKSHLWNQFKYYCNNYQLTPFLKYDCNNNSIMHALVSADLGVMPVHSLSVHNIDTTNVFLKLDEPMLSKKIFAYINRNFELSRCSKQFLKFIQSHTMNFEFETIPIINDFDNDVE